MNTKIAKRMPFDSRRGLYSPENIVTVGLPFLFRCLRLGCVTLIKQLSATVHSPQATTMRHKCLFSSRLSWVSLSLRRSRSLTFLQHLGAIQAQIQTITMGQHRNILLTLEHHLGSGLKHGRHGWHFNIFLRFLQFLSFWTLHPHLCDTLRLR